MTEGPSLDGPSKNIGSLKSACIRAIRGETEILPLRASEARQPQQFHPQNRKAWRINKSIICGEIDNRVRGRVTGRIWLEGCEEPLELKLTGNCWRDLAGRRLEFTNPEPKPAFVDDMATLQQGAVGDITASRKVKVPEIPIDQIGEYYKAKKPFPWHWGNSLSLEWFSESNGRIVIESASYDLKIVGEPAWEMSPEEEESQRKANGAAITGFMEQLSSAADLPAHEDADFNATSDKMAAEQEEISEWDEKPQTEEAAEQMQARSDLLSDRVQARLKREGDKADYEAILHEEIERLRRELGEPEPTPEQLARNEEWIDEMNRATEEALKNPDPEFEAELEAKHPLAERAFELSLQVQGTAEEEGWIPADASQKHPAAELSGAIMIAAAKLAGALNGRHWPPGIDECAGIIVRLKKAREYLDDALRAMESCQEEKLVNVQHLGPVLVEVIDLAHDADEIIAELRERLERGTD